MAQSREQRLVFGEVAEAYDRVRPGYPQELTDDVLSLAGTPARALEVGAGTGKATVSFAARGIDLVCLEPSAEMAAVARRNLAPFPRARVVVASFESWNAGKERFDLLFSAQAWHWVDAGVRYPRAHAMLVPGGTLTTFWNRPSWSDSALRSALDGVYRGRAPVLHSEGPGLPGLAGRREDPTAEIEASGYFDEVRSRTYRWSLTYTAERYVELLTTQSDHRLLDDSTRQHLLDGVRDVIESAGGKIAVDYATELYVARRVDL